MPPQVMPLQVDQPRHSRTRDRAAQRHDGIVKHVFAEEERATALLRLALHNDDQVRLALSTLRRLPGDFIGAGLRQSQTDLLFEVRHADDEAPARTIILIEHQSSPDPRMALRMLDYCNSALLAADRQRAKGEPLPRVLPVLFHQGERPWPYAPTLEHLFDPSSRPFRREPRLEYTLLDQAANPPSAIEGPPLVRAALLAMYVATGPPERRDEARDLLVRQLTAAWRDHEDEFKDVLLDYLLDVKEYEDMMDELQVALDVQEEQGPARVLMSWNERRRDEGRVEGRAEGRVEGRAEGRATGRAEERVTIVDGLLRESVGWDVIEAATGMDQAEFEALKEQVAAQVAAQ